MSRISNTAVPQEYGRFREAVLKGEIPVPETISMQMNRIDRDIENPNYYYDPDANSSKYFYYIDPNYGGGIAEFPDSGELFVPTDGVNYYFD